MRCVKIDALQNSNLVKEKQRAVGNVFPEPVSHGDQQAHHVVAFPVEFVVHEKPCSTSKQGSRMIPLSEVSEQSIYE